MDEEEESGKFITSDSEQLVKRSRRDSGRTDVKKRKSGIRTGSRGGSHQQRKRRIQRGLTRNYGNLLTAEEYDEANQSISA